MYKATALLLLVVSVSLSQERAVVFEFQPTGVDTEDARLVTVLLRERLEDLGAFTLVSPESGTRPATVEEQVAAGRALGVQKVVSGGIAGVGTKRIVSYRLIDVPTGKVELSDRATVGSMDEMDLVVERIAQAIKNRAPFSGTAEVGRFTGVERRGRAAGSSVFLTTGYTFPLVQQIPADPGVMLFTLDAAVSYETPDILAQGLMGLKRGKNSYNELYFDLLVHKLFSKLDVTPYVGGGVGVHKLSCQVRVPQGGYWNYEEREDDGLALIGSAGVILFRTQYFRVMGNLKGTVIFTEDFGINSFASFGFGLSSPTFGPGSDVNMPAPCVFGCLGAFFLTGLIAALVS